MSGARLAIASIGLYILSNDAWISVRDNLSLGVTQLTLIARISRVSAREKMSIAVSAQRDINYLAITQ